MESDVPKKMLGLFNAFKSSVAKAKSLNQSKLNDSDTSILIHSFRAILHKQEYKLFDSESISRAISRVFEAIEDKKRHIDALVDRISRKFILTKKQLDKVINSYFSSDLFSFEGALKLTAASQAISIFKKLKEITLSVIFTSTRNFSIQKNLSICV